MSSRDARTTILDNAVDDKDHAVEGVVGRSSVIETQSSRTADAQSEATTQTDAFDIQRLEELVATKERTCGVRHRETLDTMLELDLAYRFSGIFEESETVLQKVAYIMKKDLGEDHRDTLVCLTKVAEVKAALGYEEEAEQMQLSILDTRRRVLGEHDLDTINSMEQLAMWYENKGEYLKDEQILREAVRFYKSVVAANSVALGQNDAETIASAEGLKHVEGLLAGVGGSNSAALPPKDSVRHAA